MRRQVLVFLILAAGFALAEARAADEHAADRAAILAATDVYITAYNRGDAKAIADCWREKGEYVSPAGAVMKGRENIQKGIEQFLSENKGLHVELSRRRVSFVTADTAVEEGIAEVTRAEEPATRTTYQAVLVREGDAWKVDNIHETEIPTPVPHSERLKCLEWMIGEWSDETGKNEVKFEWMWDKNFIKVTFKVAGQEKSPIEGNQIIGWDPVGGTIKSWGFVSDGGYAEGTWRQNGNRWIIKFCNVLADGTKAAATNIYTRIDDNTVTWQSVGRQVEGRFMPNIPEFKCVRKSAAK